MNFNEFALKRDFDWELQHLADLNLSPDQLRIAKEKLLKAKEAAERTRAWREIYKNDPAFKAKIAARNKKYREANPDKVAAYGKKYREANPDKVAAQQKTWRENNPDKVAAIMKKYYQDNKDIVIARNKRYRENNPDKVAAYGKKYRETHKEEIAARKKAYREANKEKIAARKKKYRETHKEEIAAYGKKRYQDNKEEIIAKNKKYYQQRKNQNKNESLIESLQGHLIKFTESTLYSGMDPALYWHKVSTILKEMLVKKGDLDNVVYLCLGDYSDYDGLFYFDSDYRMVNKSPKRVYAYFTLGIPAPGSMFGGGYNVTTPPIKANYVETCIFVPKHIERYYENELMFDQKGSLVGLDPSGSIYEEPYKSKRPDADEIREKEGKIILKRIRVDLTKSPVDMAVFLFHECMKLDIKLINLLKNYCVEWRR